MSMSYRPFGDTGLRGLGLTSAAVALAWTMHHSPAIHPIVGARTLEQLHDNLSVVGVELPDDAIATLEQAAPFTAGFPNGFIDSTRSWVFGEVGERVEVRRATRP